MDILLQPLQYEFMRNAMMAGILAAILCPVVGSYLIVQRMTLLGDVLAHSVLPGMVLAFFLRFEILTGALLSGLASAGLIAWVRTQTKVKEDAAMATIFHSFFSLGIVLITMLKIRINLESFLFGDLLGIDRSDVWRTAIITLTILGLVRLFYKELLFYTFDPVGAEAMGLPVRSLYLAMITGITVTIIASMQTMGVILVVAMLATPALAAYLLVKELHHMMILGSAIAILGTIIGLYLSYYLALPSGATIVLVNFAIFFAVLLFSPSQGILINYLQK
jgi:manganese/iron transport system permease protein